MYMFLFPYAEQVNEHGSGGLAVVAEDRTQADIMISIHKYVAVSAEEWRNVSTFRIEDKGQEATLYRFPAHT